MQKVWLDIARLYLHPPFPWEWAPAGRFFMWNVGQLVFIHSQHPLFQTLQGTWSGCFSSKWCLHICELFSACIAAWSMGNFFFSGSSVLLCQPTQRGAQMCATPRASNGILATLFASELSWLKVKIMAKLPSHLHGQEEKLFPWVCKQVLDVASPSVFPQ